MLIAKVIIKQVQHNVYYDLKPKYKPVKIKPLEFLNYLKILDQLWEKLEKRKAVSRVI